MLLSGGRAIFEHAMKTFKLSSVANSNVKVPIFRSEIHEKTHGSAFSVQSPVNLHSSRGDMIELKINFKTIY